MTEASGHQGAPAGPPQGPLPQRPRLAGGDLVLARAHDTLRRYGRPEDLQDVRRHLTGPSGPPMLVVLGEVKRGKSTLVNALTGATVSPTGAEVVTTGTIAVVPASPSCRRGPPTWCSPTRRCASRVAEAVARLDRSPAADAAAPLGATMAVTSRWLPGASVVDTPGVGGLTPAHARLAGVAAASAQAVLFVTDSSQPLTAPELAFLTAIAERTEHVVFALTKVDRNPGGWQEIREENRRLLATHAPRFARTPIYPVSATYAVQAVGQSEEVAARLDEASGVPALAERLRRMLADRERVAIGNALRASASSLQRVEGRISLELRAMAEPEIRHEATAEVARLEEVKRQQRRGKLDLERDLNKVRQQAITIVNDRSEHLVTTMAGRIRQQRMGMTSAAKTAFHRDLEAELVLLAREVETLLDNMLAQLVTAAFESAQVAGELLEPTLSGDEVELKVRVRATSTMNPLIDPSIAGGGFLGTQLAATIGLAGPAGMVGGLAVVLVNLGLRGVRTGQQELAATLHDTVTRARADLTARINDRIGDLRPELHLALEDHLSDRVKELRAVIAAAERAVQDDQQERSRLEQSVTARLEAVRSRRLAVEQRLTEVAREHSAPTTPLTVDP